MKIILTGATGMVGEGVLFECLENPIVSEILLLSRKPSPERHPKVRELIVSDFMDIEKFSSDLIGYDACFYCAGISSIGMDEATYTQITYDTTLQVAKTLAGLNPDMVFTYVSGSHTDSSEKGNIMWARVKGKTENDLAKLAFKGVYNFRPGFMKPFKGQKNVKSILKFLIYIIPLLFPKKVLSLKQVGQAMVHAVQKGYSKSVLEIEDIKKLASVA